MNIYLVRHGESMGNLNRTHQGENVPLSKEGQNQVIKLATKLKNKSIDVIYASPRVLPRNSKLFQSGGVG